MNASWYPLLQNELEKDYMKELMAFLEKEKTEKEIYPKENLIFNALNQTSFEKTKVVIVGQDPYHGPNQAMGLSFSVSQKEKIPPSLKNIFKEIESDLGIKKPTHGDLTSWAKQGVLLLNSTLTVEKGKPKSHFKKGWEAFTNKIIEILWEKKKNIVFLLWGRSAIDKLNFLSPKKSHLVLTAPHPSPLSAYSGFFGSKHFSKANEFLKQHNEQQIDWSLNAPLEKI